MRTAGASTCGGNTAATADGFIKRVLLFEKRQTGTGLESTEFLRQKDENFHEDWHFRAISCRIK
ncbi:MAG TPA: hypothetical protein PLI07_10960, partial [Candidatus Hydrogenedentes bacterium]|nr:hypothetical protein [Candidatus Hydrogenedentota bacterium]